MAYTASEAIFDELAACGPLTHWTLRHKCLEQVTAPMQINTVTLALVDYSTAGIVQYDMEDDVWELTDYGYELVAAWVQPRPD